MPFSLKCPFHSNALLLKCPFYSNALFTQMPFTQMPFYSEVLFTQMPFLLKCPFHSNAIFTQMPISLKCPFYSNALEFMKHLHLSKSWSLNKDLVNSNIPVQENRSLSNAQTFSVKIFIYKHVTRGHKYFSIWL